MRIEAAQVHSTLAKSTLCEGYPMVLDLERSHGQWLVDALTGKEYLDFFTFYASRPLAFDHPRLRDRDFIDRLEHAARMKPSNGDIYTSLYAEFVETFRTKAMGPGCQHLFFVDGGGLAVENALKTAFDWKCRKNMAAGRGENPGRVLHFTHAFHGRTGYTLSLTNTHDPRKTQYFPKFDWPRVSSPAMVFSADGGGAQQTIAAEEAALAEIDRAYDRLGAHEIACIIIEPIQAEGGDRHFRPEFLRSLRKICDEREALLIFDEVQTGIASTGTMWLYEQLDVRPDVVAFAKKAQTGGIMAGARIDEVDSVFKVKSRISSTFSGNLVDFVRCTRYLEVIESEHLLDNAKKQGAHLMAGLEAMARSRPRVEAVRGRGLLCAFDVPSTQIRDALVNKARELCLLVLPCGDRAVRLRPALDVTPKDCDLALERLDQAAAAVLG
ncbi:MAG: L-lysine 6-transaminase [Deltaproteobacteria bacterium]|nr:L-lysine 6-transaminase [Deltaproteobacteria bacterium]